MAYSSWDVNESLMTGLKIAQYFQEKEDRQAMTDMYNRIYHPEMFEGKPKETKPAAPTGFAESSNIPTTKDTSTPTITDQETGVETRGLRPEQPILNTSAPTGFATDYTTDVNPTSPYDTYEQSGAESPANMPYGYGAIPKDYQPSEGVVDTTPTQETPVQTEEATTKQGSMYDQTMAEISASETKVNEHQDQLSKVKKLTDQLRSKGYFKEAAAYEEKAYEIEKNLYESTDSYYKTLGKANDLKASLASAYLDNVKRGVDPNVAWKRVIMQARIWGIPGLEEYERAKPEERDSIARSIINESTTIKEKMKNEQAAAKLKLQNDKFNRSFELKERATNERLRLENEKQNLAQQKFNKEQLTDFLKESHKEVASLREDLKTKQARYDKIRKSDYLIDEFGEVMDDDSRAAELKLLTEDINSLNKLIEVQESKIKTYGSYLEPKVVKESKDSATPKTSETTAESSKEKTGFVFTNKASAEEKANYKKYMLETTNMADRKIAEQIALEKGWIKRQ